MGQVRYRTIPHDQFSIFDFLIAIWIILHKYRFLRYLYNRLDGFENLHDVSRPRCFAFLQAITDALQGITGLSVAACL